MPEWGVFDFRKFFKMGTLYLKSGQGFRRFVGITYSATFLIIFHMPKF